MSFNDKNVLRQILLRQTRYNVWANEHIAKVCGTLEGSVFERHFGGSFPTIAATIFHIRNAEYIWYSRLMGLSPKRFPADETGNAPVEVCAQLVRGSRKLEEYVRTNDENTLSAPVIYKNLRGDVFEHSAESILAHTINHSSYHRGQVVNYLRQAGVGIVPSTDLIRFLRLDS